MNNNNDLLPAKAEPSKAFFIEMLTRDISLSDCILDLADNSIHCLIASSGLDVSEHLFSGTKARKTSANIVIDFDGKSFRVKDTCGGISIEEATNQVFLLGNPVTERNRAGLGVYGIGMKRAFFKIGKQVSIVSHTTDEEFKIDIDVDKWKNTAKWEFPFTYARPKKSATGGTQIEVTGLHDSVSDQFASKAFSTILGERASRVYALFLKAGVQITVAGVQAKPDIPELAESKDLRCFPLWLRFSDWSRV